ncbi:CCR4-NOT transcription complex subunit 2-like isoform X3 [Apostichopus japonicus]|uniref:CCR4-NOT transcription complex subunit 2-like isoform X3 n=1 Tax=Stichopus japonicus TaxID=307972 RepID=UPI003AB68A1D
MAAFGQFGMPQKPVEQQQDVSDFGLGLNKKMFGKESEYEFFHQPVFQGQRQDKDQLMSSQNNQFNHYGGLYSQPPGPPQQQQAPGPPQPPQQQQQGLGFQQNNVPRGGMPTPQQQFSGRGNHPSAIGGMPTASSSMNLPSSTLSQQQSATSPNRNITPNSIGFGRMHNFPVHQNILGSFPQSYNPTASITDSSSGTLDMSDFPALADRGRQTNEISNALGSFQSSAMTGRPQYETGRTTFQVGMVNKQPEQTSEFQIMSEDFPALPGANIGGVKDSPRFPGDKVLSSEAGNGEGNANGNSDTESARKGIKISQEGKITNIPGGMLTDPFGMVGLLTFLRAIETDPGLVQLALGSDLTTLGLNLNSQENLHSTFQSPWADAPSRPQDIDFHVPQEYLTNPHIKEKIAPIKLNRYGEDLLFYLYYSHGGDVLQVAAAAELYNRDWRYHKDERVWITRGPGMEPQVKTQTYERGVYYYFDYGRWCKVAKEFHLDYEKLEERPHLPSSIGPNTPITH